VIFTGAGGDFIPAVDFGTFSNVADPGVWSQVHDEGVQILENSFPKFGVLRLSRISISRRPYGFLSTIILGALVDQLKSKRRTEKLRQCVAMGRGMRIRAIASSTTQLAAATSSSRKQPGICVPPRGMSVTIRTAFLWFAGS